VTQTTAKGEVNNSVTDNLYMADMLAGKILPLEMISIL